MLLAAVVENQQHGRAADAFAYVFYDATLMLVVQILCFYLIFVLFGVL